jgi:PD-(D/E)XK endonuclease
MLSVLATAQPLAQAHWPHGSSERRRRPHSTRRDACASCRRLCTTRSVRREHAVRPRHRRRRQIVEGSMQDRPPPRRRCSLQRLQLLRHHQRPGESRRDYRGQIELFGVYCPDTSCAYLVPVRDVPHRSQAALRVDEPRNNQRQRIRRAADYELGRVSVRLRAEPGASSGAPAPSA